MSTINDTDLILVNRGGASYGITVAGFTSIQDTDLILVNRGGTSYKVSKGQASRISDSDLLLLNRGGESYKITGADFSSRVAITDSVTLENTSTSVLTFASNLYLGYFLGGQSVKQVAPVTPVTSAVTNVAVDTYHSDWDTDYVWSTNGNITSEWGSWGGTVEDIFTPPATDGISFRNAQNYKDNVDIDIYFTIPANPGDTLSFSFQKNQNETVRLTGTIYPDNVQSVIEPPQRENNSESWMEFNVTQTCTQLHINSNCYSGNCNSPAAYLNSAKLNGELLFDAGTPNGTQLTFADDTELNNFQAGDVLTVINPGTKVVSSLPESNQIYVDGGTWRSGDVVTGTLIDGTGIVISTDTSNNTMNLTAPIERFAIGSKLVVA